MRVLRILAVSALLVPLAGCLDSDDAGTQEVVAAEPATIQLWDLALPEYVVAANQAIAIPGNETIALRVHSASDFRFNGYFEGPVALIPWNAWGADECAWLAATVRGFEGAMADSTTTAHPAGDYLMLSFGGDGNGFGYFTGYSRNKDETYVEWLIVDGAAEFGLVDVVGSTEGLDAAWNATLTASTGGSSLVMARYSDNSDLLEPAFYSKAGQAEVTLQVGSCEPVVETGMYALPTVDEELLVAHLGGPVNATLEYKRPYDAGDHRFSLVTLDFPPLPVSGV